MRSSLRELNQRKIETIFNLVDQFKECYLDQKTDGRRFEVKEEMEDSESVQPNHITLSEFRPQEKAVNVIINTCHHPDSLPATSIKEHSCGKEELGFLEEGEEGLMELQDPSPISSLILHELVVVGRHCSPKRH